MPEKCQYQLFVCFQDFFTCELCATLRSRGKALNQAKFSFLKEKIYEKFENILTINQPANCSNSSVWREGAQGNGKKLDIVQGSPGWVTPIQVKHLGVGNKMICTYSYMYLPVYALTLKCTLKCIYS